MKMNRFNRRQFLRGLGGYSLTLPFLPSLLSYAEAQAVMTPKRFIAMWSGNGRILSSWYPTIDAANVIAPNVRERVLTSTAGDISYVFGPAFNQLKSKLLLMRGLDSLISPGHNRSVMLCAHGVNTEENERMSPIISIDQVLANSPKIYSREPKVRSLHLNTDWKCLNISFAKNSGVVTQLPAITSPQAAFDMLFGGTTQNLSEDERQRRKNRQVSVIDKVLEDYNRINANKRLSLEDKQRLDSHITFIRDLERRLASQDSAVCSAPRRPGSLDWQATDVAQREAAYSSSLSNQIDIIVAAIRCDLTRVATLIPAFRGLEYRWLQGQFSHHHSISHDGTPAGEYAIGEIYRYLGTKFAELATKLDVVEDPNTGATYLDNSVAFWGNDMSYGYQHEWQDMPVMLAGGAGSLKTGRYVDFRTLGLKERATSWAFAGRPYNQLLVTLLQSFGLTPSEYEQNASVGYGYYPATSTVYDLGDSAKRSPLPAILK
jgi:hypothetical protein